MTWVHVPGDPPEVCAACVMDMVNAPDEPMPDHDPEPIGEDEDGPYCYCGHSIQQVREP